MRSKFLTCSVCFEESLARGDQWRNLQANGDEKDFAANAAEPEQVGYYDPSRKLVIAHRHKATSHYDIKINRWKKVIDASQDSKMVPYGHDAFSPMYFDPASGHGLLVEFKTNALWAYDPDKIAWTKLTPTGAAMPTAGKRLAYVDQKYNVFVILDGTQVWAYRYRIR
jgi:hypothetical protein